MPKDSKWTKLLISSFSLDKPMHIMESTDTHAMMFIYIEAVS